MTTGEKIFSVIIRCVFILAFGAFLSASIHHVAVFFQNFEPPTVDNSVSLGSYALAVSVDGTALMLTIGMMFFNKGMPWYSKGIVWAFIIALTIFSWVVNWEYAVAYQTTDLTNNLVPAWKDINPILASSFAFLNLAYSVVSEFFGTREKTEKELQAELDGLTGVRAQLLKQIRDAKSESPDWIDQAKAKALKVKKAAEEVLAKEEEAQPKKGDVQEDVTTLSHAQKVEVEAEETTPVLDEQIDPEDGSTEEIDAEAHMEISEEPGAELFEEIPEEEYQQFYGNEDGSDEEPTTDPEVEVVQVKNNRHSGSLATSKTSTVNIATRRKPMTVSEVARELLISERQVRGLRAQGKLMKDDQDESLIKAASVRAYRASKKVKVS